jgi:hypothetical protein
MLELRIICYCTFPVNKYVLDVIKHPYTATTYAVRVTDGYCNKIHVKFTYTLFLGTRFDMLLHRRTPTYLAGDTRPGEYTFPYYRMAYTYNMQITKQRLYSLHDNTPV